MRQLQYKIILLSMVFFAVLPHDGVIDSFNTAQSQQIVSEYDEGGLIDLLQYVSEHDLRLSWDSIYNIGLISAYNVIVSFQPGLPIVLINFQQQRVLPPVIKTDGRLYASQQFIDMLHEVLIVRANEIPLALSAEPSVTTAPSTQNTPTSATIPIPSLSPDADTNNIYGLDSENTDQNISTPPPSRSMSSNANFSQIVTLVIDPGHGGKTPGAIGRFTYGGEKYVLMEKDVVLDIALSVKKALIDLYPHIQIVMTRESDEYISLEDRTVLANKYLRQLKEGEGMMFVSIHANAALTPTASGYEVWYLPPSYRRDNLVSENFNHDQIYSIINNIREEEITLESSQLATLVIKGLAEQFDEFIKNRGIKEEKFYVVRNTKMPAILIEVGFVTNAEEGYLLTQDTHKNKIAAGIVNGIHEYLQLFQ